MFYNRMGYAVLMVLAVACFVRRRVNAAVPFTQTTSFFAGLGLAFLLLLKITYFFVAAPIVVFAPAFLGNQESGIPGALWASRAWFRFSGWCSRFTLALFFGICGWFAKVARDSRPPVLPQVLALALKLWPNLAAFAIAFAAAMCLRRRNFRTVCQFAFPVAFLIGADLLFGVSNAQLPVAVLMPAEILILYEIALHCHSGQGFLDSGDRSRFGSAQTGFFSLPVFSWGHKGSHTSWSPRAAPWWPGLNEGQTVIPGSRSTPPRSKRSLCHPAGMSFQPIRRI